MNRRNAAALKAGTDTLRPPSRLKLILEARVVLELLALWLSLPRMRRTAPTGRGQPVLVVPGFATDDSWTARLRRFLDAVGYCTRGWGLGRNTGRVPQLIPQLIERTERFAESAGAPVRLVGWSLGGYLAREVARERPQVVDRVITLGAPVVGGPKYTASAPMYRRRGFDLDQIEAQLEARHQHPIEVPIAALFTRSDGVVAWRACIDERSPQVEHIEVRSSHLGLVVAPSVLLRVAELLGDDAPETLADTHRRADPNRQWEA